MSAHSVTINVASVLEIVQAIPSVRNALAPDPTYSLWFRGQSCADWTLLPKVHRPFSTERNLSFEPTDEVGMSALFMTRALSRKEGCPGDDEGERWLCLMQHHGMPTRLLDWTESVLVAAFFAVAGKEHDSEPGAIWALSPTRLNDQLGSRPSGVIPTLASTNSTVHEMVMRAFRFDAPKASAALAALPPQVDLRMLLQHSVFTIHDQCADLLRIAPALSQPILAKMEIGAQSKGPIMEELSQLGIRQSTLFPDLQCLAKDIASDAKALVVGRHRQVNGSGTGRNKRPVG